MKKVIALSLALLLLLTLAGCQKDTPLSDEEVAFLKGRLVYYGYGTSGFAADVLYDPRGNSTFMLGATDQGYIIYERDGRAFWECGEGNPYGDHMANRKFYYGPTIHVIEDSRGLYDLSRGMYLSD